MALGPQTLSIGPEAWVLVADGTETKMIQVTAWGVYLKYTDNPADAAPVALTSGYELWDRHQYGVSPPTRVWARAMDGSRAVIAF